MCGGAPSAISASSTCCIVRECSLTSGPEQTESILSLPRRIPLLPERLYWPVGGANNVVGKQVLLKPARHRRSAVAAHAHQPDAALRKPLDRGDVHIGGQAIEDDLALIKIDEQRAAHALPSRLAAAMASPTLL